MFPRIKVTLGDARKCGSRFHPQVLSSDRINLNYRCLYYLEIQSYPGNIIKYLWKQNPSQLPNLQFKWIFKFEFIYDLFCTCIVVFNE